MKKTSITKPACRLIYPSRKSDERLNSPGFSQSSSLLSGLLYSSFIIHHSSFLLARAGGGEGYSGGGGHGGGGGGGALDLIVLLIEFIWLLVVHPFIGVPLLIAIIIFVIYAQKQGTGAYQSSVLRRGSAALQGQKKSSAMEQIRKNDLLFDEPAFLSRVGVAFRKIQAAWCAQDRSGVRPFISDSVHERFLLQFAEQKDAGWRDRMEGLTINSIAIAEVESDGVFDVLAVRISAAAKDFHEAVATGKRISGDAFAKPFVEVWSFVRRRGAKTLSGHTGLIEGNCPNCGAAVEMNQSANCTHCKAALRSGEYDWVLAEITQDVEWEGGRHGSRPGVASLRQRDPDFNAVELEDRASVMLWGKGTADRLGKVDPVRKVTSPQFGEILAAQLRPAPDGQRTFFGDCAVGSVQLLGVGSNADSERAAVEIRWSGKRFAAIPGSPPRLLGDDSLFHTIYLLTRKPDSKTVAGKGISSAHCPSCGAPDSGGTSNACDYCGAVLNDGAHGWVLSDILGRAEPRGQALLQELAGARERSTAPGTIEREAVPGKLGALAWMVQVAAADGNVDENERRLLLAMAARLGVAEIYITRLIEAAGRGALQAPTPGNRDQAKDWLTSMVDMALADGNLRSEEMKVLKAVGEKVGLSEADIKLMVNQTKAQKYEASVAAIRQKKAQNL